MVEKEFGKLQKFTKKINFKKAGVLFEEFTSLCKDIKYFDETEVSDEIISELCDSIEREIKKITKDSIETLKKNKLLKIVTYH